MSMMQMLLGAGGKGPGLNPQDVFGANTWTGAAHPYSIDAGLDMSSNGGLVIIKKRNAANDWAFIDSNSDTAWSGFKSSNLAGMNPSPTSVSLSVDSDGFNLLQSEVFFNTIGDSYVSYAFNKEPGFFDVVTYTGDNSAQSIAHNLGCKPGFIITKNVNYSGHGWHTYHKYRSSPANTRTQKLNENGSQETSSAWWNSTDPTKTHFTVGTNNEINAGGGNPPYKYVAYLFADGDDSDAQVFGPTGSESIIKCGTYEGNNGSQQISCGWEPQWVLVKNIDSGSTHWRLYDSARQFSTSGTSNPPLRPNTTDQDDSTQAWFDIHPYSSGFEFNSEDDDSHNASGDTYIYIAIRKPIT